MSSSSLVGICAKEAKSSRTFCSQRTSCFDWGSWKHCCQYIKRKKIYNELLRRNINSKMVYLALNSSSPQFHFLVLKPLAVSPRFHGRDVPPQSSHGLKQYWNSFDYHILPPTTTFYLNPLLIKTLKVHYIHFKYATKPNMAAVTQSMSHDPKHPCSELCAISRKKVAFL